MKLRFESSGAGLRWRDVALSRTRFMLRRLAWYVSRARIRLGRLGDKGGYQRCEVEVIPRGSRRVVVVTVARGPGEALDAAIGRAARRVALEATVRHARSPYPRPALAFRR